MVVSVWNLLTTVTTIPRQCPGREGDTSMWVRIQKSRYIPFDLAQQGELPFARRLFSDIHPTGHMRSSRSCAELFRLSGRCSFLEATFLRAKKQYHLHSIYIL